VEVNAIHLQVFGYCVIEYWKWEIRAVSLSWLFTKE